MGDAERESPLGTETDIGEFKTLLQSCRDDWMMGTHSIVCDDPPEDPRPDSGEHLDSVVFFDTNQAGAPALSLVNTNLYNQALIYSETDDRLTENGLAQDEVQLVDMGEAEHQDNDAADIKLRLDLISEEGKPSVAESLFHRNGLLGVRIGDTLSERPQVRCNGVDIDGTWVPALKKYIHYHHHQGIQHAQVRLPQGIAGPMEMQISIDAEQLKLHLLVENMSMREALEGSLTQLRQSLLASGLQLTQTAINLYHSDTSYFSNKKQQKRECLLEGNKSNQEGNDVINQYEQPLFQRFSAII